MFGFVVPFGKGIVLAWPGWTLEFGDESPIFVRVFDGTFGFCKSWLVPDFWFNLVKMCDS